MSPLLVKASKQGREIVNVTPEGMPAICAGWSHVGFRALRLAKGEMESLDTGARELCIVVLGGSSEIALATVVRLAGPRHGVRVTLAARPSERRAAAAAALHARGLEVTRRAPGATP